MSELNRRGFLSMLIGGVAAVAAERMWPFRVYSFPAVPKISRVHVSEFGLLTPEMLQEFYLSLQIGYDEPDLIIAKDMATAEQFIRRFHGHRAS
jgi:hypothetical protein